MVYSTRTWSSGTGPDVDSDPGRVEARRPVIFDNPHIAKSQDQPPHHGVNRDGSPQHAAVRPDGLRT